MNYNFNDDSQQRNSSPQDSSNDIIPCCESGSVGSPPVTARALKWNRAHMSKAMARLCLAGLACLMPLSVVANTRSRPVSPDHQADFTAPSRSSASGSNRSTSPHGFSGGFVLANNFPTPTPTPPGPTATPGPTGTPSPTATPTPPPTPTPTASPSIKVSYQFNGRGNWSIDAVGSNGTPTGTIEALVPPGSTVEKAFLYSSLYGFFGVSTPIVNFDGTTYGGTQWTPLGINDVGGFNLGAFRTDVTAQVQQKIGTGNLNRTQFVVLSEDPLYEIDGEMLVIIYSNPGESERTIALLDGYSSSSGNTTNINLSAPLINPATPGFEALMSLGIGFGYQPSNQYSRIDVNGRRLTTSAGGQDDGEDEDGGLITAGGLDDSPENPADPFASDYSEPHYDDELYNLVRGNNANSAPFLTQGASSIRIDTQNPSSDDNIFFFGINITARAGVDKPPPEPGTR